MGETPIDNINSYIFFCATKTPQCKKKPYLSFLS